MRIDQFLEQLKQSPNSIEFEQTMTLIDNHFSYYPTAFDNGPIIYNDAGINEGSCKIFAFAKLMNLDQESTLACFGRFYREEVLEQPEMDNHGNIRAFMAFGWPGIRFDKNALTQKPHN